FPGHWVVATSLVVWFGAFDVMGLLYQMWGAPHFGPVFGRTTYPQVSSIFFVLFLLAMLRVNRGASLSSGGALAGALVLNFYTYVYSWTLAGAMLAAWLLLLMGQRRWRVCTVVAGASLAASAAAVPVWLPLLTQPPAVVDFSMRLSAEATHRPDLSVVPPVLLLLGLTALAQRRGWEHGWLWITFWLASLVVTNQQVISGLSMQPFHYLSFFVGPFAMLFFCHLACWRLGNKRLPASLVLATVALGFAQCVWRLAQPMKAERDLHTVDAAFQEVVGALRKPSLQQYGFLTNDPFLNAVLPGYVLQKPLEPWFLDPLSNAEMSTLHHAAAEALGEISPHGLKVRFDPARVLLVLNRHRRVHVTPADCQVLVSNQDFLVATLAPCGSKASQGLILQEDRTR
ncbi:MAG: hypothetical protein HY238_16220, partial [Acidobacteria bacterium]|nr:hypothetical protein [Acidobacteriota bacterium]